MCGVGDVVIQEQLLADWELKWDQAVNVATTMEAAGINLHELHLNF